MDDLNKATLIDTLITNILTPYLFYGHPDLIRTIGREGLGRVQQLHREITEMCAQDDKARRTLELFEEDPETYGSAFRLVIQKLLAQDEAWMLSIQQQIIAFNKKARRNDIPNTKSGAIAIDEGTAAGEMGVAIKGSVEGGIHIYGTPLKDSVKGTVESEQSHWQEQASYLAMAMQVYKASLQAKIHELSADQHIPYKNLFYYEICDENIFFGREEATKDFFDQINGRGKTHRLTILHAPSGAGKTSFINAGVIPALLRAGDVTLYALARIGANYKDPGAAIRKRVLDSAPTGHAQPDLSSLSLHDFLRLATSRLDGQQLIIFLDQFEEFFIHLSHEARLPFINELAVCYDDEALPVKFVISIRKDYFSDLSELETAIPAVFYNQFRLNPLSRVQAAEAITKPAALLGVHYEAELVEMLLDDLANNGMELPHLQIICSRLYETRQQNVITLTNYEKLGHSEGILSGYLVSFMDQLGSLKPVAQAVLVEMVTSKDTKRVMSRADLGIHVKDECLDEVLARLVAGRILRRDEEGGAVRYEMAHEYLIREITSWIREETRVRKQAEELLSQEVYVWKQFGILTSPDKLDIIAAQREYIYFTPEAQELLLRSALANSHDLALWPNLVSDATLRKKILDEFAVESRAAIRAHAAWTWSKLDEPASIPALMKLALEDNSPIVMAAASESLLRLVRERDNAVRELVSIARSNDRIHRSGALAILTRVPLEGLDPALRWRITMTRLRLGANYLYNRLLPQPYRRAVITGLLVILLLMGIIYGFLASSLYLDVIKGSALGNDNLIIVRNGHPILQALPGFDQPVIESDFWLDFIKPEKRSQLANGQIVIFEWEKGETDYDLWAEKVITLFSPFDHAYYSWLLDSSPKITIENMIATMNDKESDPRITLPILEEVIFFTNDPIITRQAIISLTDLLKDKDPQIRTTGIIGLSRVITPDTKPDVVGQVISNIAPLLEDENNVVRAAALEAIRHIMAVTGDTSISRQVIDLFTEHISIRGVASVDNSIFYRWLQTIIALEDPAITNYALDKIINLRKVMRSSEYNSILNYLLYPLSNLIVTTDDKEVAIQGVRAVAPLVQDQEFSTFWPITNLLHKAANVDQEVAREVVKVLTPQLSASNTSESWYMVEVFSNAVDKADSSAIAQNAYKSLKLLLNHKDREVRRVTVWWLARVAAKIKTPDLLSQTMNILIKISSDEGEDREVRLAALTGIGFIIAEADSDLTERGMEFLLSKIGDEDPLIRETVVLSLSNTVSNQIVTERVFELLTMSVLDKSADNRISASNALGNIMSTTKSPLIAQQAISMTSILLQDSDPEVRINASQQFALAFNTFDFQDPEAVSGIFASLEPLLDQRSVYASVTVASTLEDIANRIEDTAAAEQAIDKILILLRHEDAILSQSAARSLAIVTAKSKNAQLAHKVVTELLQLLKSEDDKTKIASARGLSLVIDVVGDPQVASDVSNALEGLLESNNTELQSATYAASAHARSWQDSELLLSQLQNPNKLIDRFLAASALYLAALRDPVQLTVIKGKLELLRQDPRPFVRIAVSRALVMLNVAPLIHSVNVSTDLNRAKSLLNEKLPYAYYYTPNDYSQSELRPIIPWEVSFTVTEALVKLD